MVVSMARSSRPIHSARPAQRDFQAAMKPTVPEDVIPDPGIPGPSNDAEEAINVRKWHVNRVFIFLTGTTATCMAAVVAAPNPAVLGAAAAIWSGSVILAMFLLAGVYRNRG